MWEVKKYEKTSTIYSEDLAICETVVHKDWLFFYKTTIYFLYNMIYSSL